MRGTEQNVSRAFRRHPDNLPGLYQRVLPQSFLVIVIIAVNASRQIPNAESSGIETADYDRAKAEILRQLDEIRQGLWEDWELTAARESLLSALQALGDSQGALENYYLGLAATGRRETPEEMAALLRQVTPERIRAAAQSVQLDTIYFLKGKEV